MKIPNRVLLKRKPCVFFGFFALRCNIAVCSVLESLVKVKVFVSKILSSTEVLVRLHEHSPLELLEKLLASFLNVTDCSRSDKVSSLACVF